MIQVINMPSIQVSFYDLPDETLPAADFIASLPPKLQAKTLRTVQLLEQNGASLRAPYSKHLDDGIFELRTQMSGNITRVLYFFFIGGRAILTNGFVKKTNKTPPEEIQKAKDYRAEFLSRKENQDEQEKN